MSTSLGEQVEVAAQRGTAAPAILTRGLTKRFSSGQVAVDHLDLTVPHGAVYGFLGPNGSGKTTTIRMLLGLVRPTLGDHDLLGEPMPSSESSVLPRVGALVEGPAFHPYLSGRDNLIRLDAADRTADPRGGAVRVDSALHRVGLSAAAGKRYRAYSLGMRQRLGLAGALLRPRELLVLDEPTNGLDPQGTREVRHLVREVGAAGTTVFVSSHLLAEIEQMCSHVAVMSKGKLVFSGELAALRAASGARLRVHTREAARAREVLAGLGVVPVHEADDSVLCELGDVPPERINAALVHAGVPVSQLVLERADLEELFVNLTGEGFDVER